MQLHDVHKGIHKRKKRKRIGRGVGSGHGKTSGKGHKGHSVAQGFKISPIFEGGQMPLARRVPKRGFFNGAFKKSYVVVNLIGSRGSVPRRLGRGRERPCAPAAWSRARSTTASRSWRPACFPSRWKCTRPSSASRPRPRSPQPAGRPSSCRIVRMQFSGRPGENRRPRAP